MTDLGWLAYRDWIDGGESWVGGVLAAVGWVSGQVLGPVTDREEQPVTQQLAEAEGATAAVVGLDEWHAAVLACLGLGVPYREPQISDRWFGVCVWKTLQWLLGDPESPLAIPVRNEDGSLPTVTETFEAYVNVECVVADDPTHLRRQELHEQAQHDVQTWLDLAKRIEETQRRLTAG